MANVTSSFVATGQSSSFTLDFSKNLNSKEFNVSLWGTFVGSVRVERNLDGTNWLPCTNLGAIVNFTAPMSEVLSEPEITAIYRLNCTVFTSGTINYRISQ